MTDEKKEEKKEEAAPSAPIEEKEEEKKEEEKKTPEAQPSQDLVKEELEKIDNGKKTYTKRERLNFEKKKIDEQIGVLDKEDGISAEVTDDTPVTVGMLNERAKDESKKTALGLAEAIDDEDERKLTIHYLENRIKPSGDAEADVRLARAAVNSIRNGQIAEEMVRRKDPNNISSPSGSPGSHEKEFTPTGQELEFMKPPYNLTKDDIIKARDRTQASQV